MFIAALFTMASKDTETIYMSINRWIKKMWYIHKTAYYSAIQRNETMPFATTCTDLEIK